MNCLYIHIPFCRARCLYCSFNSYPEQDYLFQRYCRAVQGEIRANRLHQPLDSLFIGGGTPTVMDKKDLIALLDTCIKQFGFSRAAEISLEANPETIDLVALQALREAGFNRISLGIQSFDDTELRTLGRIHSAARAEKAVIDVAKAGYTNMSFDLMYGLPGQSLKSWEQTLRRALELEPSHLSAYQLSIEENTAFARLAEQGRLPVPPEEAIVEMDDITQQLCGAAGLHQYEISNFARPGFECRHNLNYWRNDEYLACGAGAVSYLNGERARRILGPEQFCQALEQGEDVIAEREKLSLQESFRETVIMGLRLTNGISEKRLQQRFGLSFAAMYGTELDRLADRHLVNYDGDRLALTDRGRRFANQVMAELV